jgi:deoxyribodipyrimidine photo-lyase
MTAPASGAKSGAQTETAIAWFRRDLRIHDNPALAAACETELVVPVFCWERGLYAGRHASANRNAYLLAALRELDQVLRAAGSRLHHLHGDPAVQIPRLARAAAATTVHVNRDHTVHSRRRDRRVQEALAEREIALCGHTGISCAEIGSIAAGSGGPYKVFTPFYKAWSRAGRRDLAKRPRKISSPPGIAVGRAPAELTLGVDAAAKRVASGFGAGEKAARRRMSAAVAGADDYHRVRDLPGEDATTRLSPDLHFGTVSARELELLLLERGSKGAHELRRQLAWRDFWLNVIRNFPDNRTLEYDERMRGLRWRRSQEDLEAWKQGNTGVPWIDAGMRQLRAEGWMHNRVRMAVASYLTKNLLIDWRQGEAHFMEHLLDGDESQNNGNWQWAASVGADPQPYFRVFNPVRQQQKFDPDGTYVRRWVPELRELADEHLAEPWEAPEEVQREAGCVIGEDYPGPLVDLKESRAEAIERFRAQREKSS